MEIITESRKSLLAILDACPVGIARVRNGVLEWANEWLCQAVGYTSKELRGMSVSAFYPHDEEYREVLKKLHKGGQAEVRMKKKDGGLLDVLLTASQADDGSQILTVTDGAKQKRAESRARSITDGAEHGGRERTLPESEEKYRHVFEEANDALLLMDQETGRVLDINDAACALYGYTKEEWRQLKAVDVTAEPEESARAVRRRHVRASRRLHRRKDGTLFPADISLSYFTLKGRPVILGAVRDMTELKAAEDELKTHSQWLETLVQERTRELNRKTKALEELKGALRVVLHQVQEDRESLEERFVANVNRLVLPYLEKMKKSRLSEQQSSYLDVMEANLNDIMSPFLHDVQQLNLTPREIQVANLIRDGKSTKEIAGAIGVAPDAVNSYRNSIRLKLGLNKKKVNLQSYLQSLGHKGPTS